jgi:hypothetical protein
MGLLDYAGFAIEKTISTLFQRPGRVTCVEPPREGFFANAGFTIIIAEKADPITNW